MFVTKPTTNLHCLVKRNILHDFAELHCIVEDVVGTLAETLTGLSDHLRQLLVRLVTNTWSTLEFLPGVLETGTGSMAGTPLRDLLFSMLMTLGSGAQAVLPTSVIS